MKQYKHNEITYHFDRSFRKWVFKTDLFAVIHPANGIETAHKIARIMEGARKRNAAEPLDGMARSQIKRLGV